MNHASRWPALRGGLIALTAALLFGVSTPLVQRFGVGIGSFTTAALLYAGAAMIGALLRQPIEREAGVQRSDASLVALFESKYRMERLIADNPDFMLAANASGFAGS